MHCPAPSRVRVALAAGALTLLAACREPVPVAPAGGAPPDLAASGFRIRVHRDGGVEVTPPQPAGSAAGPVFSLLGAEAVTLQVSGVQWIPAGTKVLVTLQLALGNELDEVDLVTPTAFPRPPQGVTGVLVFPFAAAALGNPGGPVTATAEWDGAPHNFFNDGSCTPGGKGPKAQSLPNDCYRYEAYASPLYGGAETATRTVGFEAPADAAGVEFYAVVAADLRENPVQTAVIPVEAALDGFVVAVFADPATRFVHLTSNQFAAGGLLYLGTDEAIARAILGFPLGVLGPAVKVDHALVTARQAPQGGGNDAYLHFGGPLMFEHIAIAPPASASLFDSPVLAGGSGVFTSSYDETTPTVDVSAALQADLDAGRPYLGLRLRFGFDLNAYFAALAQFDAAEIGTGATLTVHYRMK